MVYVLSKDNKTLMPTKRYAKVRILLKNNLAEVVRRKPFTIKLLYVTKEYIQPATLGIDIGYSCSGFSAINEKEELLCCNFNLLEGQSERLHIRKIYRSNRKSRSRYRKRRSNNRKLHKGWMPPSIQHKLDSHIRFILFLKSIIPINKTIIEESKFDTHKIKNPAIKGVEYHNGELKNSPSLRDYILYRDNYTCVLCGIRDVPLQIHHLGYWKNDRSNRPSNLVALCVNCHTPLNHAKGAILWGMKPKTKSLKGATFMSMVRRRLVDILQCESTYGYITKCKRIDFNLEKTHYNDAYVIAGGTNQRRIEPIHFEQIRRNNRSLERFHDKKVIDIRTSDDKKVNGQNLFNGRRTRNKNFNSENLRIFRGKTISKGQRRIRKQRYFYQPKAIVTFKNKDHVVKSAQGYGRYVKLEGEPKLVKAELVKIKKFMKGICVTNK